MPAGYEIIPGDGQQTIAPLESGKATLEIHGYEINKCKRVFSVFLNLIFVGLPWLLCQWSSSCKTTLLYSKCALERASIVLVLEDGTNPVFSRVETIELSKLGPEMQKVKFFIHHHLKYVWSTDNQKFVCLTNFFEPKTFKDIRESQPPQNDVFLDLLKLYGNNEIEIEIKSYWRLFVEEILSPFYVFQIFSICLWSYDNYVVYAGVVLFLLLLSAFTSLYQTRKQSVALHNMIKMEQSNVTVLETSNDVITRKTKDSRELVPGDILVVPRNGLKMQCDAVVLTGKLLVNESSLTGESVPVMKVPALPTESDVYSVANHKKHTVFSGTQILQGRYYNGEDICVLVTNTGFNTLKGNLVNSILNPSPVGLKFYNDSILIVKILGILALFGVFYSGYLYYKRHASVNDMIVRAIDLFTILVPPALPAAMTVGMSYSQNRLKKNSIFCTSPQRINICGKIKLACFDKTGTLTDEGLELKNVISYEYDAEGVKIRNVEFYSDEKSMFLRGITTCHSLTTVNGELIGDPVDLAIFQACNWSLEEPGAQEENQFDVLGGTIVKPRQAMILLQGGLSIIQQFDFTSNQQCMSVIVKDLENPSMLVFTKGAPEKIKNFCKDETVPENFFSMLEKYTAKGYRVLALCYKVLPENFKWKDAQTAKRESIECDLTFLGFIILKNALKLESEPVISELTAANIRTVMITGDHIMTALSVARNCKMIQPHETCLILKHRNNPDNISTMPVLYVEHAGQEVNIRDVININGYHLAVDGKTWDILWKFYKEYLPNFLMKITVFARFQPDQKTQLVNEFSTLDYIVSMVGDGANDCGALKAAHVGISLSQAEASVAAPFTSARTNISCLTDLIKEGRCALVTSFATFKYMMLYSLIQFFSVVILYSNYSILGDWQFLFIDLIITTVLAITIGYQGPSKKLVKKRPMGSLVASKNILPMIFQIAVCGGLQYASLLFLRRQKWFKPLEPDPEDTVLCWENTVIFLTSCFQYITMAAIFSKGPPYRQSIFRNYWFVFCSSILVMFVVYITIHPCDKLAEILELEPFKNEEKYMKFRQDLLVIPVFQLIFAVVIELVFVQFEWFPKLLHFISCKRRPKNCFKRLQDEDIVVELLENSTRRSHVVSFFA